MTHVTLNKKSIRKLFKEVRWRRVSRGNIRMKGYELPVTAIIGLVATVAIWVVIIVVQDYSRWVGFGWMAVGLAGYLIFRWRRSITQRQTGRGPE